MAAAPTHPTSVRPAFDGDGEPAPLEPEAWRRPYRIGAYRVAAATLLLALCPMLLLGAVLSFLADGTTRASVAGAVALVVVALAVRILRCGVWVSRRGLRRVSLLRTRTLTWPEVAELRVAQEPVRVLGTPRRANGQAVAVVPVGGPVLEEVLTDHNADFHGKDRDEDFEAAVTALTDWYSESTGRRPAGRAA